MGKNSSSPSLVSAKIRASHSRLSQSCRLTALSSLGADGRKYDLMKRADLNDLGQYDCVVMVTDHSDYDSPASFVRLLQNASTTTPETSNRPESFLPRRTRGRRKRMTQMQLRWRDG